MFLIIAGILTVLGSICAGYLLEQGNLWVLMQPAELVIIAGGATGIILVSSPGRNLRLLLHALRSACTQRSSTREGSMDTLKVLYVLFHLGR